MSYFEISVIKTPWLDTQLLVKTFKNGYFIDAGDTLLWWFSQNSNILHH